MNGNIYDIPGFPNRPKSVEDLAKIYSDHVPQLMVIPDFSSSIFTWNVYNNALCGYPWQHMLNAPLNYFSKEKMYLQETIEEVFKKRASLRR